MTETPYEWAGGDEAIRRAAQLSALDPDRCEHQDPCKRLVVAVEMKNAGLVLVGARCDEQVWYWHAMAACRGELALGGACDRDRLGVGPKLVECVEIVLELLERAR